jgi:hypothetical protein
MLYYCRDCELEFETEAEAARCPKCLRKSSVGPAGQKPPRGKMAKRTKKKSGRLSPVWMFVGFAMVLAQIGVSLKHGWPGLSTAEAVGQLIGRLLFLAAAAWAIERGLRAAWAEPPARRNVWIGLAIGAVALIVFTAIKALSHTPDAGS